MTMTMTMIIPPAQQPKNQHAFQFGGRSESHLASLDPKLTRLARKAITISRVDFTIISGRRNMAEQRALVRAGKSQTLNSRHLSGKALDFVPLDPDTGKGSFSRALAIEVAIAFYEAARLQQTPIIWGGMWQNFEDIPHIELAE